MVAVCAARGNATECRRLRRPGLDTPLPAPMASSTRPFEPACPTVSTLPLSVIIPLGPGETAWRALLGDLDALSAEHEVLLVGAGEPAPEDFEESNRQRAVPPRWLSAATGRASQQNAGAEAARGRWLCFLHADSRLPPAALAQLAALPQREPGLYYFDLRFAADGPRLMALNTVGAWLRSRCLGLPFGDQGLCLPKAEFVRLGGFDTALSRAEDHALVWAAHRAELPVRSLRAPILTSARRYAEHGWLRTTLRFVWLSLRQATAFSRGQRL
jgi:hypothetical protein